MKTFNNMKILHWSSSFLDIKEVECLMSEARGGSSIKSDHIQKLDAEGHEWHSHEPLGGSGGMRSQKILKTRTHKCYFLHFGMSILNNN